MRHVVGLVASTVLVASSAFACSEAPDDAVWGGGAPGDADGGTSGAPVDRAEASAPRTETNPTEPACEPERKRCDGRCIALDDPLYGCSRASCGAPCELPHAEATCSRDECAVRSCEPGHIDCDRDPTNGCETQAPSCGACAAGRADCDGNPSNGCETDIDTDVRSCGGCGVGCGGAHALPACASGRCALDCLPGWADCDGDNANGCETDVDGDALSCGACGHACLGRACATGECGGAGLATPLARATELAADATHLFWLESGRAGLFGSARDGSAPRAVSPQGGGATGLALDDTFAFWIDPAGALLRANKDGTQTAAIVSGLSGGGFVAVGPRYVYFTQRASGSVWMAEKDGTGARAIASGLPEPMGVTADASGVFWVTAGGATKMGAVMAAAPDGTGVRTLVRGQRWASGIAADASHLYWTARGDRTVMRATKSGAGLFMLMNGLLDPQRVAVDGAYVYVVDAAQGVFRVPAQGGASLRLASGEMDPQALAVEGPWVVFSDATRAPTFQLKQVAK
jgi:hypothetical protein